MKASSMIIVTAVASICALLFPPLSTEPAQPPDRLQSIEFSAPTIQASGSMQVDLTFDGPADEATALRAREEYLAIAPAQQPEDRLRCRENLQRSDAHGTFYLQYTCGATEAVLAWNIRLTPQVRATVVGNVTEDGMWWWRNGGRQTKLAAHTRWANYNFHGSLSPVWNSDTVQYQNQLTWRHNIGPGGTARAAFAGTVRLG